MVCEITQDMPHFCVLMSQKMHADVWKTDPEWFKPWFNTKAYHVLYGDRSESEAQNLVEALTRHGGIGTPGRALDAGCGAGRHARALAAQGWQVDAFDLSEASIREAQSMETRNASFQCLDLRALRAQEQWHATFDLVTNFFTSLGYFSSSSEHEAVVEGFAKVMKPGGKLVVDFLNLSRVERHLVEEETTIRSGISFQIHRRIHQGWIEKSIQFEWEGAWHHHVERVRALAPEDLRELLVRHGLVVVDLWGNYELSNWTPSSPRCILLAERPTKHP